MSRDNCALCGGGPHESDWPHYVSGFLAVCIFYIVLYLILAAVV